MELFHDCEKINMCSRCGFLPFSPRAFFSPSPPALPPLTFPSFTSFSVSQPPFHLFASFCWNADVEVKIRATAGPLDRTRPTQTHVLVFVLMRCHVLPHPLLLFLLCYFIILTAPECSTLCYAGCVCVCV